MPTRETFRFETSRGRILDGLLDLPDEAGRRPTVLLCHGFKGFMEWGFFPYLAQRLSEDGMTVVRFNLSGSGMRPGEDWVSDPDAFRSATYTKDLEELSEILSAVGERIAPRRADREAVGLLGHSRGGGTSIIAASTSPARERLRALVTWSAISTVERLAEDEIRAWRASGAFPVVNTRTGQKLELGTEVLEDVLAHRDRLDVQRAARERGMPWLIVHGEADETVPLSEGESLADAAGETAEFLPVPGASHTFGAQQPFVGTTPQLEMALDATRAWLKRYLAPEPGR
ncbi:MAG TPA: alpha/beta fold hydrolase [Thermoanaerobaculia bacterium]|nr:alpha/beta fold hydrolase [Thermoanaerobaculia bacterium]